MKVLKLTLENVEKIKNETNNRLVKRVCRYIISNWEYYDDKKNIFLSFLLLLLILKATPKSRLI